jgi:hypothetical protein
VLRKKFSDVSLFGELRIITIAKSLQQFQNRVTKGKATNQEGKKNKGLPGLVLSSPPHVSLT